MLRDIDAGAHPPVRGSQVPDVRTFAPDLGAAEHDELLALLLGIIAERRATGHTVAFGDALRHPLVARQLADLPPFRRFAVANRVLAEALRVSQTPRQRSATERVMEAIRVRGGRLDRHDVLAAVGLGRGLH